MGSVAAYAAVKTVGCKPSLNLLWAIEGALTDRDWKEISRDERMSLLIQLDDHERREKSQTLDVMTHSKNISPHGWYVGSYLLRFIELVQEDNEDPERRFITWENTVLVKANNLDEAYDKVVQVAMENTILYKGGPQGVDVQWVFEGVTDLLPIYEEIGDGAEIMWADHAPRKLKNIRKQVRKKGDFSQ